MTFIIYANKTVTLLFTTQKSAVANLRLLRVTEKLRHGALVVGHKSQYTQCAIRCSRSYVLSDLLESDECDSEGLTFLADR